MAWSDAARAAAAEARRNMHRSLVSGTSAKRHGMLRASLRSTAAKTIRHNKAILGGALKGPKLNQALYMTAGLKVDIVKRDMMNGLRRLHPMYSKGLSAQKMFGKK